MSHFTVIVCLPADAEQDIQDALGAALAPFDEDKELLPYRDYIENWQEKYGRALKFYTENPKRKPAGLDELSVTDVLSAYHAMEVFEETAEDSPVVLFYSMSTYNPRAKWDRWSIGGRWTGYFLPKHEWARSVRLLLGRSGSFGNKPTEGRVDGGPKFMLDLAMMREEDAIKAGGRYDDWSKLVHGLPEAKPWTHFYGLYEADQQGYAIERARKDYHAQPRVRAASESKDFRWFDNVIEHFAVPREAYCQRAADQAVPGYAVLDLDGDWQAPGRMGWFGVSSDGEEERAAYQQRMNTYLDELPDDTILVAVDCHI